MKNLLLLVMMLFMFSCCVDINDIKMKEDIQAQTGYKVDSMLKMKYDDEIIFKTDNSFFIVEGTYLSDSFKINDIIDITNVTPNELRILHRGIFYTPYNDILVYKGILNKTGKEINKTTNSVVTSTYNNNNDNSIHVVVEYKLDEISFDIEFNSGDVIKTIMDYIKNNSEQLFGNNYMTSYDYDKIKIKQINFK
jgi:hypothetical protein